MPVRHDTLSSLRIIGGQWRSRRLLFVARAGLRPTPDRIRETLFNWLAPVIPGARCLDLFAGSGALGMEALSRGASAVTFVEQDVIAAQALRENLTRLGATGGDVYREKALDFLQRKATAYDIVFLDPPFGQGWLAPACTALENQGWLADSAWVYVEAEAEGIPPLLPSTWSWHREKVSGAVAYRLARRMALES